MDQRQRNRAMRDFTRGEYLALIATDVAARGIDIEGINSVIHYDPAENGKSYKHRSGRTARAGATGTVISMVQHPQKKLCSRIQKEAGIKIAFRPPDFKELPEYDVKFIPGPRGKKESRKNGGGKPRVKKDGGSRHDRQPRSGRRKNKKSSRGSGGRGGYSRRNRN